MSYWNDELIDLRKENEELIEMLKEVSYSGVELDDPRMSYVILQMDSDLWKKIKALAAKNQEPPKNE